MSAPRRILILRNEISPGTVRAQAIEPFRKHAKRLRDELEMQVEEACAETPSAIELLVGNYSGDIALVMVKHEHDPAAIRAMFERLHARRPRPAIVFHDCFDQSSSLFWDSLPFVDRYAKKVLLRDVESYKRDLFGGFVLSDFLHRERHYDFPPGWRAGVTMPAQADTGKVVLGWNFAMASSYRRIATISRWLAPKPSRRSGDINCRFGMGAYDDWYAKYRRDAFEAATVVSSTPTHSSNRIGLIRYLREQMRSKLVFSPFGYGEICLRDVEVMASGAVLLKPSIEHLRMTGDLFEAGVTYLPMRWDFSDFRELLKQALDDPRRLDAMSAEAERRLRVYRDSGWVDDVRRVFENLSRVSLIAAH